MRQYAIGFFDRLAFFATVLYLSRMIVPAQCRAARGLLDWNQKMLAERAGIGVVTIRNFEKGKTSPYKGTIVILQQTFEAAGVAFTNAGEPGVKLRRRE